MAGNSTNLRSQKLLRTMRAVLPLTVAGPRPAAGGEASDDAQRSSSGSSNSNTPSSVAADTVSQTSTAVADVAEIATACEAVALLAHACMTLLGFRLVGLREDEPLDAVFYGEEAATADATTSESQMNTQPAVINRLPHHWNATPAALSFVYAHPQSSLRFVVRVDRMGATAEIRGLSLTSSGGGGGSNDRIVRFAFPMADYIAASALPWRQPIDTVSSSPDFSTLRAVFVDDDHLVRLAQRIRIDIVQPLLPGLPLHGNDESGIVAADQPDHSHNYNDPDNGPYPHDPRLDDPLAEPRVPPPPAVAGREPRPLGDFPPPGFDDEYDLLRGPRGGGMGGFSGIGGDDLHPPGLGPHDPLRPSFAGGGGLGGVGGFGGMHPTFDDPLFQGPRGGRGGRGGLGYDAQVPPGARYDDPTGPTEDELGGISGLGRGGRLGGGQGGFGGGHGRGFGGGGGFGGFGGFGGGII